MFSLQYAAIVAMMFDEITLECFEAKARETLAGACQRVTLARSLDISMRFPQEWRARVTLHHSSGRRFVAEAEGAQPQPDVGLLEDAVGKKAQAMFSRIGKDEIDLISAVPGRSSLDKPFVFTVPE